MSNAETKPAGQAEPKPAVKDVTKPAGQTETKPVDKAETRQAGKGSKRRPFNAKQFAVNYRSIRWSKGQSQRPKH
jgi:hypothetical protein